MCAPTGHRSPFGSPDPSGFTYSKLFSCSGGIPPGGLSVSGDKAKGTPLRQRPHILAASSSGSILSLFDCKKFSNPTTSVMIILKTASCHSDRAHEAPARCNSRLRLLEQIARVRRVAGDPVGIVLDR